jgi:hypothetical protein
VHDRAGQRVNVARDPPFPACAFLLQSHLVGSAGSMGALVLPGRSSYRVTSGRQMPVSGRG